MAISRRFHGNNAPLYAAQTYETLAIEYN